MRWIHRLLLSRTRSNFVAKREGLIQILPCLGCFQQTFNLALFVAVVVISLDFCALHHVIQLGACLCLHFFRSRNSTVSFEPITRFGLAFNVRLAVNEARKIGVGVASLCFCLGYVYSCNKVKWCSTGLLFSDLSDIAPLMHGNCTFPCWGSVGDFWVGKCWPLILAGHCCVDSFL